MSELVEQAKTLGIEVNPEWSEQYIKRQITMAQKEQGAGDDPVDPEVRMFPVRLLKNYRPLGSYEIVGHNRPEIAQKDAAGRKVIVQEAAFIEGEASPPPFPGVGFENKIWADTVIRLPVDEARTLVQKRLAERADALPA